LLVIMNLTRNIIIVLWHKVETKNQNHRKTSYDKNTYISF
jgi:hypothetical protein